MTIRPISLSCIAITLGLGCSRCADVSYGGKPTLKLAELPGNRTLEILSRLLGAAGSLRRTRG